jgi:phage/plasmid-like protein (TIGR03299 family)
MHHMETMAYKRQVPWHSLGINAPSDADLDTMLELSGTNWEVAKFPSWVTVGNEFVETGQHALVRLSDKKVLTNVGADWNYTQNREAFEFFRKFCENGTAEIETAGSLKDGQYVWVLAKLKKGFKVCGKDEIQSYLLFTNPHVFGAAIDIRFTNIRVVCWNTMRFALKADSDAIVRVTHRARFNAEKVQQTLGIAEDRMNEYKEFAEFVSSKKFTKEAVQEYFSKVFNGGDAKKEKDKRWATRETNADRAFKVLDAQPGANLGEGTWWQAFNAITFQLDHLYGEDRDNRLVNSWYGNGNNQKRLAAKLAVDFAKLSDGLTSQTKKKVAVAA